MHGPDGRDYPNTITFTEIEKPKRIAYHHSGAEGSEPVSVTFRTIVTFEDFGGKTKITMKGIFNSAAELEKIDSMYGARDGAQQTMDRLVEKVAALSGESTFVISRTFNAPRELMFQVWTDPEHMKKWWVPKDCKILKAKMDLRPGGSYHYGMQTPDGSSSWGKNVYREIVNPERLVYVNSFSDENGGLTRHPLGQTWPLETLTTITFLEIGGKTTLTIEWTPINATAEEIKTFEEGRPGMLVGWTGSLDLLSGYCHEQIDLSGFRAH
jgi:uncharacterized protein YndB with AHSA1/START domain